MRLKGLLLLLVLMASISGAAWGQMVEIDEVTGSNPQGELETGQIITFTIRFLGNENTHSVVNNGFRVYSPDGAQWTNTVPDTLPGLLGYFFPVPIGVFSYNCDGVDADTVGFCGIDMAGVGMPAYFDGAVYTIDIGPIDEAYAGRTIIVDSSLYPPAGAWVWGDVDVVPQWGGPYEYTIGEISDDPFAYTEDDPIIAQIPARGFINIYFGNFGQWGKTIDDVDIKSVKINSAKPASLTVVQQDPKYGVPAFKASVSLRGFLQVYEPYSSSIQGTFTVTGKFFDKQQFSIYGDVNVEIYPSAGDFNGDGTTDKTDLDMLVAYLYNSPSATPNDPAYDVDGNGQVNVVDYLELKKLISAE